MTEPTTDGNYAAPPVTGSIDVPAPGAPTTTILVGTATSSAIAPAGGQLPMTGVSMIEPLSAIGTLLLVAGALLAFGARIFRKNRPEHD